MYCNNLVPILIPKLTVDLFSYLLIIPYALFMGYVGITVCPSFCLSMQIRVRPETIFCFDICIPYLAHGCITIKQCVTYIHASNMMLTFDLKVNFLMIFDMSSCSTFNFGVFLHLHFIHDTWDYHREAICHVITIQLTFDLKVKIYMVFDMAWYWSHSFFFL